MDYYNLAERNYKSALDLYKTENYMSSVYFCCLTIELFLKSKLMFVNHNSDLEASHDIINLYYAISSKYKSSRNLVKEMRFCRKYFNESRYPSFTNIDKIYTKEFAE